MNLKQSGVALITVMLILALATVTAVSMVSRQNIDIHRSANTFNYEQAYQYISGAEDYVKQKLISYFSGSTVTVTEADIQTWKVSFPIEGGKLSGKVEDLQACFNVNKLVDSTGVANRLQMNRYRNLLTNLTLNSNLTEAIVDWIDVKQDQLGLNGVEDNGYLGNEPPYRTADHPMSDISELLLIKGIDHAIYQTLLPHVCILNKVDSKINVNTASAEVISSLDRRISLIDAQTLVTARAQKSFDSVPDFISDPIFSGLTINQSDLSVSSDFFRLTTLAQIEKTNLKFISILHRDPATGKIVVIKRSRSVL